MTSAATGGPYTYVEAMQSLQQDHWKRAMEEESSTIRLNNTISALNFREAQQLQVKLIGSKLVYKTTHSPDGSTWYTAGRVINGWQQMDFGETYTLIGKLTTSRDLNSLTGKFKTGWNMNNLDVLTAFVNPEIDDDDIHMTLPEGWPESSNAPMIVVRLRRAHYGPKQAPWLWHDDIEAFPLSLWLTQSSADPNLHLRSDGILMRQYDDDIPMAYPDAATTAAIEVKAKLQENYKIMNLSPGRQFLRIEIHCPDTNIILGQKAYIATILRPFGMEHTHGASTPMVRNGKLDLAEDRGETELEQDDITDYQAVGDH